MTNEKQSPWNKLHTVSCDVSYYLQEVDSTKIVPSKHALDMMLKYILREIEDVKTILLAEEKLKDKVLEKND